MNSQKITMLIEILPCPRLDIVSERQGAKLGPVNARGHVDDVLVNQSFNDSGLRAEIQGPSFAFNIAPEDLLLLDSEQCEALLSGTQEEIVMSFFYGEAGNRGNDQGEQSQKQQTEVKFTFLSVFQDPKRRQKRIRRENENRAYDKGPDNVSNRYLQKFEKFCERIQQRFL